MISKLLNLFKSPYVINLLSALTGFLSYRIYTYLKGLKGCLSGRWYGVVYDEKQNIVKYDVYKVSHSGENLYVTGRRLYPAEQTHRKWDFNGVYRDRLVSGFFKSLDLSENSLGCVLLKNDKKGKELIGTVKFFV